MSAPRKSEKINIEGHEVTVNELTPTDMVNYYPFLVEQGRAFSQVGDEGSMIIALARSDENMAAMLMSTVEHDFDLPVSEWGMSAVRKVIKAFERVNADFFGMVAEDVTKAIIDIPKTPKKA